MKQLCAGFASAVALLVLAPPVAAADLVETAKASVTLKTFLAAARTSGIADTLKNSGPYTVFAPNDSAFNNLPPETVDAILKDKDKAAALVSRHIIPGKVMVADVKPGKIQTIQGAPVTLTSDNGKVTVDHANVIQSDLLADNGVIHEIDAVVLPDK